MQRDNTIDRGIKILETATSLTLSWDNRTASKERYLGCMLVLFTCVWVPATLIVSALLVRAAADYKPETIFFVLWLVFGWGGTLLLIHTFFTRWWRESIVIDASAITLSHAGPLGEKTKTFPLDWITEIWIGRQGEETMVTLNLLLSHKVPFWSRRMLLGYWLAPELKEQVFQAIESFVETHDFDVAMTRYNSP